MLLVFYKSFHKKCPMKEKYLDTSPSCCFVLPAQQINCINASYFGYHHNYFKSSLIALHKKYNILNTDFHYNIHELHRDPGKGNVIADCVITPTPITFISYLFSMFYQFMSTIENFLEKMYIKGSLMSKSRNIASSSLTNLS